MKVINFLGAPSYGKSTAAYNLVGIMKEKGYKVDIILEYPKKLIWTGCENLLKDQLHVFSEQNLALTYLKDKLDYVIVDSPLILCYLYAKDHYKFNPLPESFFNMVIDVFNMYDNEIILMNKKHDFESFGRNHNEFESNQKQNEIIEFLKLHKLPYKNFDSVDKNNSLPYNQRLFDFCIQNKIII